MLDRPGKVIHLQFGFGTMMSANVIRRKDITIFLLWVSELGIYSSADQYYMKYLIGATFVRYKWHENYGNGLQMVLSGMKVKQETVMADLKLCDVTVFTYIILNR